MDEQKLLARQFEANRKWLETVAYRMLGSRSEAEDAVQEAWLRLARADAGNVGNFGGWLTTVVARLCLDQLRQRKARREEPLESPDDTGGSPASQAVDGGAGPEREIELADSVGLAMLVVLDTLAPAERVAFVLHDMFAVPFGDIAPIVDRSEEATRQLASRARRRVQGARTTGQVDQAQRRQVVDAFIAASRGGDFSALLALLAPDVALSGDATAMRLGQQSKIAGAQQVAAFFSGRARAAQPALVDGTVDIAVVPGGRVMLALRLDIADGRIRAIEAVADPDRLAAMRIETIEG